MTVGELSAATMEQLVKRRYDRIVGKHEGPETWEFLLHDGEAEFLDVDGRSVLLPLAREQRPNVTILRSFLSSDEQSLVVFLKDTTFVEDPADEKWSAGFVGICDRYPGECFYVAVVYHEWFIVPYFDQSHPL